MDRPHVDMDPTQKHGSEVGRHEGRSVGRPWRRAMRPRADVDHWPPQKGQMSMRLPVSCAQRSR